MVLGGSFPPELQRAGAEYGDERLTLDRRTFCDLATACFKTRRHSAGVSHEDPRYEQRRTTSHAVVAWRALATRYLLRTQPPESPVGGQRMRPKWAKEVETARVYPVDFFIPPGVAKQDLTVEGLEYLIFDGLKDLAGLYLKAVRQEGQAWALAQLATSGMGAVVMETYADVVGLLDDVAEPVVEPGSGSQRLDLPEPQGSH